MFNSTKNLFKYNYNEWLEMIKMMMQKKLTRRTSSKDMEKFTNFFWKLNC